MKGAYLNYASTDSPGNGQFNYSDRAYPQVINQRLASERAKIRLLQLVGAPPEARVIINSGATESIATCVHWAKESNKYGVMVGSRFDHAAVEDNCKLYGLRYEQSIQKGIADNASAVFLTHVNSRTGEILNMDNFCNNVYGMYSFLNESDNALNTSSNIIQYRPLMFLDATQSICKIPVKMASWHLNAVFFSLHKLGGPQGVGVMIIDDTKTAPFIPLIAGKQQLSMRGGTLPQTVINDLKLKNRFDEINKRKSKWQSAYDYLTGQGLTVYSPKGKHLYNTLLIDIGKCPMSIINELADVYGVYVGNVSACQNEVEQPSQPVGNVNPFEKAIRVTFKDPDELTDKALAAIANTILLERS